MRRSVAFLFLGEMLLIPHLYPIAEALAPEADLDIDLWVSTSVHEDLLATWVGELGRPNMRIRRAPGYKRVEGFERGENPPLPAKLPMLARLLPLLLKSSIVVCAEQTSLWLPTLLPLPMRFVKTSHGVGSMSARDDRRRRSAWLTFVPSELERKTYLDRGMSPNRIVATGYVKAGFRQRSHRQLPFAEDRPTILYTPHWQQHRSSWWDWGRDVVRMLVEDRRFNIILAPHQRLVERAPEVREVLASVQGLPNVHCDLDSFAMVDGSYTHAADIYLGDTSSQVIEFLMRPRPCVFLNPQGVNWSGNESYRQWSCGEVVTKLDDLLPALDRASAEHPRFAKLQAEFAAQSLGDTSGAAASIAADLILQAIDRPAVFGRRKSLGIT